MTNKKITWDALKREIHRMDPNLAEEDEVFMVAVLLLASSIVGATRPALMEFTGLPKATIGRYARMFEVNKLWKGGKVCASDWFEKDTGPIGFWCDVMVAQGLLRHERVRAKP